MIVVLTSYELINVAYYILLPWSTMSSSDAVAVMAMKSFGSWVGTLVSLLVALSCAGSITSNIFTIGRLTVVAAQHRYIPSIFSIRGLPVIPSLRSTERPSEEAPLLAASPAEHDQNTAECAVDAPMYAIIEDIRLILTFPAMPTPWRLWSLLSTSSLAASVHYLHSSVWRVGSFTSAQYSA